jgi:hypothetical protein
MVASTLALFESLTCGWSLSKRIINRHRDRGNTATSNQLLQQSPAKVGQRSKRVDAKCETMEQRSQRVDGCGPSGGHLVTGADQYSKRRT